MLSNKQSIQVLDTALSFLGLPYTANFNCVDFVRAVYGDALGRSIPPVSHNLTYDDLDRHRINTCFSGYVLYLRHKKSKKIWSHIGILFGHDSLIHNSYFFGGKVTVSSLSEIMDIYDIA